jgi:hypothetical protein
MLELLDRFGKKKRTLQPTIQIFSNYSLIVRNIIIITYHKTKFTKPKTLKELVVSFEQIVTIVNKEVGKKNGMSKNNKM